MSAIGRRLSWIRKRRRLSQAELAAAIGVTNSAISQYESGRVTIKVPRLEQLAQALHCRVADLLAPIHAPLSRRGTGFPGGGRSSRDAITMRDPHLSEAELARAVQLAILGAIEEVLGRDRAIPADTYANCLVGLYLAAAPPGSAAALERLVATFGTRLGLALSKSDVAGHA
jgi:transcriptional regulator with XRE-family HTH domain